jgi:hypothetical protein
VPTKHRDRAPTLDLNLLRVLDALLDERSVTGAAGRVLRRLLVRSCA